MAPGTGLSDSTIANPIATPSSPTTYTVTVTTSGCVSSAADTVTITIHPVPNVTVNPAAITVCSGTSVNLLASGADTYSWSIATGLNDSAIANPTATLSSSHTYTITGTTAGCSGTATSAFTVKMVPVVNASASSTTICSGNTTNLLAGGATDYVWSPSTGLNDSVIANPSATLISPATYTVTGTTNGCSGTDIIAIAVNPAPPTPTITPSGPTSFCVGGMVTLTSSASTGNTWNTAAMTSFIIVSSSGPYFVTVTGANSCTATSSVTTVTVHPLPTANAGNDTTILMPGGIASLNAILIVIRQLRHQVIKHILLQ